jgi:hypothetical protein
MRPWVLMRQAGIEFTLVMWIKIYDLPVPDTVAAYADRIGQLHSVQQWIREAESEQDYRMFGKT